MIKVEGLWDTVRLVPGVYEVIRTNEKSIDKKWAGTSH